MGIFGRHFMRKWAHRLKPWLIAAAVVVALGALVLVFLSMLRQREQLAASAPTGGVAYATVADDLQTVLDRHASAIGGQDLLRNLRSFHMTGKLFAGDDTFAASILKRHPRMLRFSLTDIQGNENVRITHGDDSWQKHGESWIALKSEGLREDSYLLTPLARACTGQASAELLESREFDGKSYHVVKVDLGSDSYSISYISKESYLEELAELHLPGGVVDRQQNSDFRDVGGMILPHRIVAKRFEGETILAESELIIETAALNVGVLKSVFDVGEAF